MGESMNSKRFWTGKVFVGVLVLIVLTQIGSCENNKLRAEEVNNSGLVHDNSVEEVPAESFLVYEMTTEERVRINMIEPISIYVTVQGDDIIGFSLRDNIAGFTSRNNVLITFSSIELTADDFNVFRNALEKALEWGLTAHQNDVNGFQKNIPFEITSNNVSWVALTPSWNSVNHTIKKGETLTLEFIFSWTPHYIESARSALSINSNTINTSVPDSEDTFHFSKKGMHRSEIELLLGRITDDKIQEAIVNGRIQQEEDEARKKRTETLFN
jgi:hypothetical protein